MVSIVLSTGSMEEVTLQLFKEADFPVIRLDGARGYCGKILDFRFGEVKLLRPQDIPQYVADGLFHIGITGQDWLEETGLRNQVVEVCTLPLTKSQIGQAKLVLCVSENSTEITTPQDLPKGCLVETEYPAITKNFFKKQDIDVNVRLSHGATEGKVPGICQAIVELTETGTTLKKNRLKIIAELMTTTACLIANKEAFKQHQQVINEIKILLKGAISARGKVLLMFHIDAEKLPELTAILPDFSTPTISQIIGRTNLREVVVLVSKHKVDNNFDANTIITKLMAIGADSIVELPVSKWVQKGAN